MILTSSHPGGLKEGDTFEVFEGFAITIENHLGECYEPFFSGLHVGGDGWRAAQVFGFALFEGQPELDPSAVNVTYCLKCESFTWTSRLPRSATTRALAASSLASGGPDTVHCFEQCSGHSVDDVFKPGWESCA